MVLENLIDKLKRYYMFRKKEVQDMFVVTFLLGIILSFRKWGLGAQFDVKVGFYNLVISMLIVGLAIVIKESAHRVFGLIMGYMSEYKPSWYGTFIGLLLCFMTNGKLILLVPGGVAYSLIERHRLGKYRYGLNYKGMGWVSWTGPLANVIFAVLLKLFTFLPGEHLLLERIIAINLMIALVAYLPLPTFEGAYLFFSSRLLWLFTYSCLAVAAVLVYFLNPIVTLIITPIIAALIYLLYYIVFEQNIWNPYI